MPSSPRRTILVEVRKDPVCAAMLDAMAETCGDMGHRVVRWRGPLSGRMPYGRSLPVCDLAILFNGAHRSYRPVMARLQAWGVATLMVELGWHPQANRYQVDHRGVNASASWAREPIETDGNAPLSIRRQGDLLLLMQLDNDTQISEQSPWFSSMEQLIRFVCSSSELPVRVRRHPKSPQVEHLRGIVEECGAEWDASSSLEGALAGCRAAACVNSSAAVAALDAGLPVLCYGNAIYRHPGVVYCLNQDPLATIAATKEIASGMSSLNQEKIAKLVQRIVARQWTAADVAARLPPLVADLLAATPQVSPKLTSSDRVEHSIYWLADLPARLLYRRRLKSPRVA
jgi:hypothetical protein